MGLPNPETPLYNHPLPALEQWLSLLGCQRDDKERHCWFLRRPYWDANLTLETEELIVCYFPRQPERRIVRSFKYSLSRKDVEAAVLEGP